MMDRLNAEETANMLDVGTRKVGRATDGRAAR